MATKHLGALEQRLGVRLCHRTTRRLTLTNAGLDYLATCRRILLDLEESESELAAQGNEAVGLLRMNVPIRIGHLADSDLRVRRLGDYPMRVCASPVYLEHHGTPRKVSELISHQCLSYSLSSQQGEGTWSFGRNGEVKVPVQGPLKANNGDALLAAAVGGQGVIYQPDFIVADALCDETLVELELDLPVVELGGLHVLFPPDRRLSAKVRAMIDFLVEAFAISSRA